MSIFDEAERGRIGDDAGGERGLTQLRCGDRLGCKRVKGYNDVAWVKIPYGLSTSKWVATETREPNVTIRIQYCTSSFSHSNTGVGGREGDFYQCSENARRLVYEGKGQRRSEGVVVYNNTEGTEVLINARVKAESKSWRTSKRCLYLYYLCMYYVRSSREVACKTGLPYRMHVLSSTRVTINIGGGSGKGSDLPPVSGRVRAMRYRKACNEMYPNSPLRWLARGTGYIT
jgi:hypothetical protein